MTILNSASVVVYAGKKQRNYKMKSTLLAFAAAATANELVDISAVVNTADAGWHAEKPTQFNTFNEVQNVCGTINDNRTLLSSKAKAPMNNFPVDFDSRTHWSNCTIIGKVGSQAGCGSCWAWSATEVAESFMCIKGQLDTGIELSKLDTASCCSGAACGYSQSCTSGTPSAAMMWIERTGVVSGGAFNSSIGCEPYSLAPCSVDPTDPTDPLPACHEPKPPPTLTCSSTCSNPGFKTPYASDKRGANNGWYPNGLSYRDDNNSHAMAYMIENGPISATFSVMEDFPTYRHGIYQHVSGKFLGGHAILIVGYGTENGTDYWTVKNSWSEYWGEGGFFRIRRGVDEVGIESHMTGWNKQIDENLQL